MVFFVYDEYFMQYFIYDHHAAFGMCFQNITCHVLSILKYIRHLPKILCI